jgi:DegV family protein with EDD domain
MNRETAAAVVSLDGVTLAAALRAGIRRLLANQEHLNKINVFPVPDGDTGTNLALTLSVVFSALATRESHVGSVLVRVADAAIDGARGNSGAILAQFFVGLGDRVEKLPVLSTRDFANAVASGAAYAREALSEPREGTILTVITDFVSEVATLVREQSVSDFIALFRRALERARQSLDDTRLQLEALRKANVVDAGAQGFVELVQGMSDYLSGEVEDSDGEVTVLHDDMEAAGAEIDLDHRFCAECTISSASIDRRKLREALGELGSSVVVAGTAQKAKVHVHVDDPAAVFRLARSYGAVSAQKADDLRKQQGAAHHRTRRGVAIVVDSAADVPEEELERLEIHVIPLRVHFGERSFLDKISMTQAEFYRELETNPLHPKTSQPPPGDFRRTFEFLASHYATVVSINVTAKVSGTLAAAQAAAERVQTHGRVIVIDSLNASLGEGLVAMYAAECAQAGYTGEEVVKATRAIIPNTHTYALVGRLDFAVRGGRVPRLVKTIADFLHLTPVLINQRKGKVGTGTVMFGRSDLTNRFARLIRRRMADDVGYRVAVGHANAEAQGRRLLEVICEGLDNIHARYLTPLGTALGVHGGPGMLVVGTQEYEPPSPRQAAAAPPSG